MVQSTSTAIETRYGIESTYNVVPASMKIMRGVLDDSIEPQNEYAESDERTADLQSPSRSLTYKKAGGTINIEDSPGAIDDFKQLAMNSAGWSAEVVGTFAGGSTVDFAFTAGVNKMTTAGTGSVVWSSALPGIVAGSWIYVSNATNPLNNGAWQVVNGPTTQVITVMGPKQMATESVGGGTISVKLMGAVSTGVAKNSVTVERKYADLTNEFSRATGGIVTSIEKSFAAKGKVTGSITVEFTGETSATTQIAAPSAAPTKQFYSVNQHFKGATTLATASTKTRIVSASYKIEHPDFPFDDAGTLGPLAFGKARFVVSGTVDIYFEGAGAGTPYQAFESGARVPLCFFFDDGALSADVDEFPSVILTTGARSKKGGDVGTMVSYSWVADRHATFGIMARMARLRAA